MDRIQIVSIVLSLLIFMGVFNLIRRKMLKTEYSLMWLSVSLIFILFSFWKQGIDVMAAFFGISYAPSVLFLLLLVGVFLILIEFSLIISKQAEKIKVLTQEMGLMKQQLEQRIKMIETDIVKNNRNEKKITK